ncbi:MAG: hypothetical protein UX92_C0012G0020 [Candidatus Amesbacteria bacterium GW2011_GWA1_47_20]|uniref:RNA polymerase sigma factor 70 region 4 type 2 domain-containing protein n=1 Tax=Candidatus Amesbacteria bacterium GW2011_GWA1_47_20 TaxID=1618354 RepID=A0A0G1SJT2_9BACT|nr:MAG: hypothetical protein UX92_C0012G0020 [Candidatus Amesbacteria bacterium GW2011_GWA1_47_20]
MFNPTAEVAEGKVAVEWLMTRLAERLPQARKMDFIISAMGYDSTEAARLSGVSGARVRESLAYAGVELRQMAEEDPSIAEIVRELGRERAEFW